MRAAADRTEGETTSTNTDSGGTHARESTGMWQGITAATRLKMAGKWPVLKPLLQQMWLPAFFVVAFSLCYVFAFHAPTPQDVKVGVVASDSQAPGLAKQLDQSTHGVTDAHPVDSLSDARAQVKDGTLDAAYAPGKPGGDAQLFVASGAQMQLANIAEETFKPVASAAHTDLAVHDVAPLPANDLFGTALFYLALVWTIAGYMVGMFIGMIAKTFSVRSQLGVHIGITGILALVSTLLAGPVVGAFTGHFWPMFLLGWGTAVATGAVVIGLSNFVGKYVTGLALLVFVFVNVPSSNGAYPHQFLPQPFDWLENVVSGASVMGISRYLIYDVGGSIAGDVWRLVIYFAVGLALMISGKYFAAWKGRRAERKEAAEVTEMGGTGDIEDEIAAAEHATPAGDAVLSGIVRANDGRALGGAHVHVLDSEGTEIGTGLTGSDGQYYVSGLPQGQHRVEVSVRGSSRDVNLPSEGGRVVSVILGHDSTTSRTAQETVSAGT